MQPHLIKCFDCIKALAFSDSDPNTIVAMVSAEGEVVQLLKPLKARGAVEEWLSRVEEIMQQTLHKLLRTALADAPSLSSLRLAWCRRHPSQLVLTGAQVEWGCFAERPNRMQLFGCALLVLGSAGCAPGAREGGAGARRTK